MKKLFFILITLVTLITGGCRNILSNPSTDPVYPDNFIEDSKPESEVNEHISSDAMLHFPTGFITLLSYENDMDLNAVLGDPQAIKTIVLENADTFNGSFLKTLDFQDTTLVLFSLPQAGTSYNHSGLSANTSYSYKVRSYKLVDETIKVFSDFTNPVSALTPPLPVTPPTAPAGLTATALDASRISLSWKAGSGTIDGYYVQRKLSGGAWGAPVSINNPSAVSFTDTGLNANTTNTTVFSPSTAVASPHIQLKQTQPPLK